MAEAQTLAPLFEAGRAGMVLALLACAAAAAPAAPLSEQDARSIETDARRLASALDPQATDAAIITSLTFPGIVDFVGGPAAHTEIVRKAQEMMAQQHMRLLSFKVRIDPSTTFAGPFEVVRATDEALVESDGGRMEIDSFSLVVRKRPDGPWTFISGSAMRSDTEKLHQLLPDLPADFSLPPVHMKPL